MMDYGTADHKARAAAWFRALRDDFCARLEALEDELAPDAPMGARPPGRFERRTWTRDGEAGGAERPRRIRRRIGRRRRDVGAARARAGKSRG
ncbi:MAG: hypothetical protein ACYYKD_05375 [Rhodospirillales bacterium]